MAGSESTHTSLSRKERLSLALDLWALEPPVSNGLLSYKQLTDCIDSIEDQEIGHDFWDCPRTFLNGQRTDRIYTILPESFHNVKYYSGVTLLLAKHELIFVSRFGAVEVQNKMKEDKYGVFVHYNNRSDEVIFRKIDASGHDVWHAKNMS